MAAFPPSGTFSTPPPPPSRASFHDIFTRGQQTGGVWSFFAPALSFGTLTLAPFQADVAAMPATDQAVVDAEAVIDEKRNLRDAKLTLIREIATRLPRLAAQTLAPEDSLQDDIAQAQGIEMQGEERIMDRGQSTLTIWMETNVRRAAATPALSPLLLPKAGGGTWAAADFSAALTAVPVLGQQVKDAAAPLSEKRSARRTLATRVDRANKRWFGAWGAHFPEGTPEHDALSQITTEGGGSGDPGNGSGGGGTPNPLQAVIDSATVTGAGAVALVFHATGAGAVTYRVLRKTGTGPGDFDELATGLTVGEFTTEPGAGTFVFKVIATDDTGDGPESEEETVVVPA